MSNEKHRTANAGASGTSERPERSGHPGASSGPDGLGGDLPRPRTWAKPRILIVGSGDVALRIIQCLHAQRPPAFRIYAVARRLERCAALRDAGAVPILADLDQPATLDRLRGLAQNVLHLAPPPNQGQRDTRTRRLLTCLGQVERLVYVSTTGVYGDCQGERFDETRVVHPATARAVRRVDAERVLRRWALQTGTRLSILRVPGIYAQDRLPLDRLRTGTPALIPADDPYTNHIHADDLARIVIAALFHGLSQRIYHASDDSELRMGEYFDRVADAFGLPRPPRLPRSELATHVSPAMLSFMNESRRLRNARMKAELDIRLRYPSVDDGIHAAAAAAKPEVAHRAV